MYCKFCGKPLRDNSRFCGLCGKEQEIPLYRSSQDEDFRKSKTKAEIYTVISLIIEVTIIVLSFTKVFRIEMGNGAISQSLTPQGIEINLFDFFDIADILSVFDNSIIDSTIIDVLCGLGIILMSVIGVCIIYFLYVNRYVGLLYKKYSIIPAMTFGVVSIVAIIIFSVNMKKVGRVLPSPSLNTIFILIGIQFALNKICSFEETEDEEDDEDGNENEDEEDYQDDENDDEYKDDKETDENIKTDFWGRRIW